MTQPPRFPLKPVLYIALGVAGLLIIVGSLIALNQSGISGRQLVANISQFTTRLVGVNLVVKVDHPTLPADGQSQAIIVATPIRIRQMVTASIISGSGQIERTPTTDEPYRFTYTAGSTPGEVSILIRAGSLERTVTITLADAVIPAAPVITAPPDGITLDTSDPEIVGTGLPNLRIIITNNGTPNTTTRTDANGQFRTHLDTPLYNGQHTLAATAVNDLGISSPVSNLVTVTVQTEPVKLDTANIRVSPARVVAGQSFAVFVPASLNTAKIVAEFEGRTYQLADHNQSSIFSSVFPAPTQPGAYSISLIATDTAGNASRFDRLIRVTVVSG